MQIFSYDTLSRLSRIFIVVLFSLVIFIFPQAATFAATPSILNSTYVDVGSVGTGDSRSFDSGSTGSNRMLVILFGSTAGSAPTLSATYNSVSMTCVPSNSNNAFTSGYCYLANPAMGSNTLALTYNSQRPWYHVVTLQDVSAVDSDAFLDSYPSQGTTGSSSISTAQGNELILAHILVDTNVSASLAPSGSGSAISTNYSSVNTASNMLMTQAAANSGSNSFGATWSGSKYWQVSGVAFKGIFQPSVINSTYVDVGSVGTSDSRSIDSGTTGSNRMLVVLFGSAAGTSPTLSATYNGTSMTCVPSNSNNAFTSGYCYLANPTTGSNTLALTYNAQRPWYYAVTLQDTSGVDTDAFLDSYPSQAATGSSSITTAENNELILSQILVDTNVSGSLSPSATASSLGVNYSSVNTASNLLMSQVASTTGSNAFGATWSGNKYWHVSGIAFKKVVTPSILNSTYVDVGSVGTGDSRSFDSGSTGSNRMLVILFGSTAGSAPTLSATYNSVSMTCVPSNSNNAFTSGYCYLANPAMGSNTLALTYNSQRPWYHVVTLQDVSAVDSDAFLDSYPSQGTTGSSSISTAQGNELILAHILVDTNVSASLAPSGSGSAISTNYSSVNTASNMLMTQAAANSGSNSFGATWSGSKYWQVSGVAFKGM